MINTGVEHVFQSKAFIENTRNVLKEKYGENWKKEKAKPMMNYWKNNVYIHHNGDDPNTRAKMVESWKKTISKKPIEEILKWRKAILSTKSKIATEFLNELSNNLNTEIKREYLVGSRHVDGLIDQKCIIEFYGNFWHANPTIYKETDIICHHGKSMTAKEIWEHDKQRLEEIQQHLNLPIIIVWEKDYTFNKQLVIDSITNYIKNHLKNNQIYFFNGDNNE